MIEPLDTPRLHLRPLTLADEPRLHPILQDLKVMYAWEHAFSDEEIHEWLLENLRRYRTDGYSYMAVETRDNCELAGLSGLLTEHVDGNAIPGIGWIFGQRFWGQGLAQESAKALLSTAFRMPGITRVIATIRPENTPSISLAERLGMQQNGIFTKLYRGKQMPHLIYEINRDGWHTHSAKQ